jgi:hypothetical protein
MTGVQLIAAVFALAMLYQVYMNFRRSELSIGGVVFWAGLWLVLLAVTLFPGVFQRLISVVHVARLLDLVTIGGLLILGGVAYQLQVSIRRQQRSIENLVRSLALRDLPAELPGN